MTSSAPKDLGTKLNFSDLSTDSQETDDGLFRWGWKVALEVQKRLQRLGPGWHVLHDVAKGEGVDVEHLLVGAPGLFVITDYDAQLPPLPRGRVDRARMDNLLRVVQHEARIVARRLDRLMGETLSAWPVVVVRDGSLDVTKTPDDAYVVSEPLLIPWLKSLMPVLSPDSVAALASLAATADTWAVGA